MIIPTLTSAFIYLFFDILCFYLDMYRTYEVFILCQLPILVSRYGPDLREWGKRAGLGFLGGCNSPWLALGQHSLRFESQDVFTD